MKRQSAIRRFIAIASIAIAAVVAVTVPAVRAQSPPVEAMFIRAVVDNERPYLGQQITYSLRIYLSKAANLTSLRLNYNPPDFAGFWNSQQTRQDEYDESVGNSEYRVVEVRTVLFPSVVGALEIEPAVLDVSTGTSGTPGRLRSPVVAMEVRPLPIPEPDGFTGAVGRFQISASVNAADGRANEPVLLTVRISGEGNIEAIPDPDWPEFAGWRVIQSPVSVERQIVAGQITGSRTYEITLVPEQAGGFAIPEIQYPYFDPALEQYVELATSPIAMSIADAAGASSVPSTPSVEVSQEDPEMRPIKAVPPSLRQGRTDLVDSKVFWVAWAIPVLIIAAAVAWRRRRVSREASRAAALRDRALPDARAALARAVASSLDARVAASQAMLSYLSARLEFQVSGTTREALLRRLRDAGVSPDLEIKVGEMLTAGESARYTPLAAGQVGADGHVERVSQLLGELEGELTA